MRSISALCLSLSTAVALVAAPAAASDDRVSITVPTHDLNLTTAAGQRALESRINRAAQEICNSGIRSVAARARDAACMANIRDQADAQMPGATTAALTVRSPRG